MVTGLKGFAIPSLEFLHFSGGCGLGETSVGQLDVQILDQVGMVDHFLPQRD